MSPALAAEFFTSGPPGKPITFRQITSNTFQENLNINTILKENYISNNSSKKMLSLRHTLKSLDLHLFKPLRQLHASYTTAVM